MRCPMLQSLPDEKLRGVLVKEGEKYIFQWEKSFERENWEEIKKKLEWASGSEVIEFEGSKKELEEKLESLNQKE